MFGEADDDMYLAKSYDELIAYVRSALDAYYHKDYLPLLCSLTPDVVFIGAGPDIAFSLDDLLGECGNDIEMPSCHMSNERFDCKPLAFEDGKPTLAVVTGFYDLFTEGDRPMIAAAHQRLTVLMRFEGSAWRTFYIHSSNEWGELTEGETFPVQVSSQTFDYVTRILKKADDLSIGESGQSSSMIHVPIKNTVHGIDPSQLLYVRAVGKYSEAHMEDQVIPLKRSIGEMEEQLAGSGFRRIHRSFLVNRAFVRCLERGELMLRNGEWIPVPIRRVAEIRAWLTEGA